MPGMPKRRGTDCKVSAETQTTAHRRDRLDFSAAEIRFAAEINLSEARAKNPERWFLLATKLWVARDFRPDCTRIE
jgi:hypothetical protein